MSNSSEAPGLEVIREAVRQQELLMSATNQRAQVLDARATGLLTVFGTSAIVVVGIVFALNEKLPNVEQLRFAGSVLAGGLAIAAALASFSTIRLKFFLPGFQWHELHPASGFPANEFLFHVAYVLDKRIAYNVTRLANAARWQWTSATMALVSLLIALVLALQIEIWSVAKLATAHGG